MNRVALIGIGNRYRGDDAVGYHVVDTLQKELPQGLSTHKVQADPAVILDIFQNHDTVFIVDATPKRGSTESWRRLDVTTSTPFEEERVTSTHGLTLRETLALARNLDMIPKQVIIYLIPGENFTMSEGLSPSVKLEAANVANALKKEIEACMNTAS